MHSQFLNQSILDKPAPMPKRSGKTDMLYLFTIKEESHDLLSYEDIDQSYFFDLEQRYKNEGITIERNPKRRSDQNPIAKKHSSLKEMALLMHMGGNPTKKKRSTSRMKK